MGKWIRWLKNSRTFKGFWKTYNLWRIKRIKKHKPYMTKSELIKIWNEVHPDKKVYLYKKK